jgi:acetolactate decarboxylase
MDYNGFSRFLDACLPSPNMLYAIRVDAHFDLIRTRSVPRTQNYTPLVEAAAHQEESELRDVEGTLVGFYTPGFVPSVNVPGYHFHLLTTDRAHGGHLLSCAPTRGTLAIQFYTRLSLDLPMTLDYLGADFERDAKEDLETAEREKKE